MYVGTTEQLINALNHMADKRSITKAEKSITREAANRLGSGRCCGGMDVRWLNKYSDLDIHPYGLTDINLYCCEGCGNITAKAD